ncbi:MAG: peptidylprolyl isomerase [Alphaproteobacteria bacterium]|jgi:peptidyl-prolyl cis-trans isomerase C
MKIRFLAAFVLFAPATALALDDYVMIKVNGQNISAAEVERSWEALFPPGTAPEFDTANETVRQNVLRGIITEKLILIEAEKQGTDKIASVQQKIEDAKRKIVLRAFLDQRTASLISEADIKSAYEQLVKKLSGEEEVRARHILVATEKEADDLYDKIEDGGDFAKLAEEFSKDPASAGQGGDLGYFTHDKMVKPFANAAFSLKKGETSKPVESPFGWHVIKAEDRRPVTIPTLNEARDEIASDLRDKKLGSYVSGLLNAADISYFTPKGKEMAFDKNPAKLESND